LIEALLSTFLVQDNGCHENAAEALSLMTNHSKYIKQITAADGIQILADAIETSPWVTDETAPVSINGKACASKALDDISNLYKKNAGLVIAARAKAYEAAASKCPAP